MLIANIYLSKKIDFWQLYFSFSSPSLFPTSLILFLRLTYHISHNISLSLSFVSLLYLYIYLCTRENHNSTTPPPPRIILTAACTCPCLEKHLHNLSYQSNFLASQSYIWHAYISYQIDDGNGSQQLYYLIEIFLNVISGN